MSAKVTAKKPTKAAAKKPVAKRPAKKVVPAGMMSVTQYAEHAGKTQGYISRLLTNGVLEWASAEEKLLDPAACDVRMEQRRDPSKQGVVDRHAREKLEKAAGKFKAPEMTYHAARVQAETFRAKTAELNYRERAGELCETALVELAVQNAFGATRKTLESLADRLSTRLAAEHDPRKCHTMITNEVDVALSTLASNIESFIDKRTAEKAAQH